MAKLAIAFDNINLRLSRSVLERRSKFCDSKSHCHKFLSAGNVVQVN